MKKQLLFILLVTTLFSCQQPEKEVFSYEALDWQMELPSNWKVMEMAIIEKEMSEAIEETKNHTDLTFTGKEKVLLRLEKDDLNNFQATATPFKESYEGEWKARYPILKSQLYNLFKGMGAKVDTTSSIAEIGGITFEVFDIDISEPISRIKFHKKMFRTYLNEQDFVVNLTYDRKFYGRKLEETFKNSKFGKQQK